MSSSERIDSFRDLKVWQSAMDAAESILELTDSGPIARKLRFAGQFEAAAISVPANIAEGHSGATTKVYINHLYIARGSLAETLTYLELAARRKYIPRATVKSLWNLLQTVARMLNGLLNALERKPKKKDTSGSVRRLRSPKP